MAPKQKLSKCQEKSKQRLSKMNAYQRIFKVFSNCVFVIRTSKQSMTARVKLAVKNIFLFNHIWQNDDIEVIQHLKAVDKTKINIKPKNENYEKEPGEGTRLDRCETFDLSLKSKVSHCFTE